MRLRDQFGTLRARVLNPLVLCNPVKKNREPIENPLAHLRCYAISVRAGFATRRVAVVNQLGVEILSVLRPERLYVPSTKRSLGRRPPPVAAIPSENHFVCYAVRGTGRRVERPVLSDQFGVERVRLVRAVSLCAPAQKNAEPVPHPVRHLVCYRAVPVRIRSVRPRVVLVRNQFGVEVVRVLRAETLCVPSVKFVYHGGRPRGPRSRRSHPQRSSPAARAGRPREPGTP